MAASGGPNDYKFIKETEYGKELIGHNIHFFEPMLYLNLSNSKPGFLKQNSDISRMLATVAQTEDNDLHIKEPIDDGMKFKLIEIQRMVFTDLASWSEDAREMYLSYSKNNPEIDMNFILQDENGVLSTVGAGNYGISEPVPSN